MRAMRPARSPPPRRRLAIARRLLEQDPGNTEWLRDVAIGLERLGGLKLSAGDTAGALAAYDEGLAIRRRLSRIDQGNTLWQRDVAIGLGEIGDVKMTQNDSAGRSPRSRRVLSSSAAWPMPTRPMPSGNTTSRRLSIRSAT